VRYTQASWWEIPGTSALVFARLVEFFTKNQEFNLNLEEQEV
jgi:hypothetical protein